MTKLAVAGNGKFESLRHDPFAQILCVSYVQDLADKLGRDCRGIMWCPGIFPTRLAAHRQAAQGFVTTRQGYRLATSTSGVLIGRGADIITIDDPPNGSPSFAPLRAQRRGRPITAIPLQRVQLLAAQSGRQRDNPVA